MKNKSKSFESQARSPSYRLIDKLEQNITNDLFHWNPHEKHGTTARRPLVVCGTKHSGKKRPPCTGFAKSRPAAHGPRRMARGAWPATTQRPDGPAARGPRTGNTVYTVTPENSSTIVQWLADP